MPSACKYPIEKKLHVSNVLSRIYEFFQARIESNDQCSPISYTAPKSIKDAEHFRQRGIALAKEGNFFGAYQSFNRSLASAPLESTELSLAYAERSAYSFSQGFYDYCLIDIEQALMGKLSEDLKKQLYERKRNAELRAKFCTEAESSPHYLEHELSDRRQQRNNSKFPTSCNFESKNDHSRNTTSKENYMVAEEGIRPDPIISAERCHSQKLKSQADIRSMYCAFCFLWCPFLIPCSSCTEVMYCSRICRQKAYDAYHRTECKIIKYFLGDETDETIELALQLLFIGTNQGKGLQELMKTMTLYDKVMEEFRPSPELRSTSDYLMFLNTIRDGRSWDEEATIQRTMTIPPAVNTAIALRNASDLEEEDISPDLAESNSVVMEDWKEIISNAACATCRFICENEAYFVEWLSHNDSKIVIRNKKSDKEDSPKREIVDTQFSDDDANGNILLLSEEHKKTSDMAKENDDTTTKLFGMLDIEANHNNIENCSNRNVPEIESHTSRENDGKENDLFLEDHNTAVLSNNPSTEGCRFEHSVMEDGLRAKIIEEFEKNVGTNISDVRRKAIGNLLATAVEDMIKSISEKLSTSEKIACEKNIKAIQNDDIDLVFPESKIDERAFTQRTSETIEEEPATEYSIIGNTTASLEDEINEASSSSSEEKIKIDEKSLHGAKLLTLIDNIYKSLLESGCIFDQCSSDYKSEEESKKHRISAKEFEDKSELMSAHLYICASIASAPNDSEELALAYAERSAILLNIGKWLGLENSHDCLLDVNRATTLGKCPKPIKKSLRERKKECLRMRDVARNRDKRQPTCNGDATDPCKIECTEKFSLSPKLKVSENNTIVAMKAIMPGEKLMKERLEVTALEMCNQYMCCSRCLSSFMTLIPCPSCSVFMFCNEECLNEAYESYHRSECQMMDFLFDRDGNDKDIGVRIALRAFLIGTKQGKDIPKLLAHFKPLYGTQEEDVDSAKLTCVEDFLIALKTDESLITRFKAALPSAVEIVMALRSFPFFSEKYSKPPSRLSEEEILSTLLLAMNLISMGRCKSKFQITFQLVAKEDSRNIGYGIYIEQNRVTHSCYPNTIAVYRQGYRYLYSSRVIEEGEQVTYSSFCQLKDFTLDERKNNLAQEGLTCECEACLENWPSKEEFEQQEMQFKDNHSSKTMISSLEMARKKYSNAIRVDELPLLISDCIYVLCMGLKQPSPIIIEFEEMLRFLLNCNFFLFGSTRGPPEYLRKKFIRAFVRLMKCLKSTKL